MEKYRYGPLVFITKGMDESEGNYFWAGNPPVGYDKTGVPIDENGLQCVDIECPLHPRYTPTETIYNRTLNTNIPTEESVKKWFDDNFLFVSDDQIKKYIFKWWVENNKDYHLYQSLLRSYKSVNDIIGAVWQQDEVK